jgi:hypothetical protein
MPACFRPNEKDEVQEDGWREPPGYLGEAVRRAKLIPSRANSGRPLQSVDCGAVQCQTSIATLMIEDWRLKTGD